MPNARVLDVWGHGPVLCISPVHHRGPPLLSPWKTQCAPSSLLAECLSMECQSIDLMWLWSCAGLGAHPGERGACPLAMQAQVTPCNWVPNCVAWVFMHRSAMMGLLEVKGIAAPEVKFLDRSKTNCCEGALQVHVHRSRMRVWGAKMIRHRRSPQL